MLKINRNKALKIPTQTRVNKIIEESISRQSNARNLTINRNRNDSQQKIIISSDTSSSLSSDLRGIILSEFTYPEEIYKALAGKENGITTLGGRLPELLSGHLTKPEVFISKEKYVAQKVNALLRPKMIQELTQELQAHVRKYPFDIMNFMYYLGIRDHPITGERFNSETMADYKEVSRDQRPYHVTAMAQMNNIQLFPRVYNDIPFDPDSNPIDTPIPIESITKDWVLRDSHLANALDEDRVTIDLIKEYVGDKNLNQVVLYEANYIKDRTLNTKSEDDYKDAVDNAFKLFNHILNADVQKRYSYLINEQRFLELSQLIDDNMFQKPLKNPDGLGDAKGYVINKLKEFKYPKHHIFKDIQPDLKQIFVLYTIASMFSDSEEAVKNLDKYGYFSATNLHTISWNYSDDDFTRDAMNHRNHFGLEDDFIELKNYFPDHVKVALLKDFLLQRTDNRYVAVLSAKFANLELLIAAIEEVDKNINPPHFIPCITHMNSNHSSEECLKPSDYHLAHYPHSAPSGYQPSAQSKEPKSSTQLTNKSTTITSYNKSVPNTYQIVVKHADKDCIRHPGAHNNGSCQVQISEIQQLLKQSPLLCETCVRDKRPTLQAMSHNTGQHRDMKPKTDSTQLGNIAKQASQPFSAHTSVSNKNRGKLIYVTDEEFDTLYGSKDHRLVNYNRLALDSGSNRHFFQPSIATKVTYHDGQVQLAGENNSIKSIGTCDLGILKDVVVSNELRNNLISHSKLCLDYPNLRITTDHQGGYVHDVLGNIYATFTLDDDGIYYADDNDDIINLIDQSNTTKHTISSSNINTDSSCNALSYRDFLKGGSKNQLAYTRANIPPYQLVHIKTGHQSKETCDNMLKHNMVIGLGVTYDDIKNEEWVMCDACMEGKMRALPIPSSFSESEYDLMEFISFDVIPFKIRSRYGNKYLAVFVDKSSTSIFIYGMKEKSELFDKFLTIQRQYSPNRNNRFKRTKIIQADSGSEGLSQEFQNHCKDTDIQIQPGAPYKHQQTLAERYIETLKDGLRTAMRYNQAPPTNWEDAAEYFVYHHSRSPKKGSLMTRHQHLTGETPDLSGAVPFFALGYMHLTLAERSLLSEGKALAPKAKQVRMLGYAPNDPDIKYRNSYRVLTATNQILIRHDCIFPLYQDISVSLLTRNVVDQKGLTSHNNDPTDYDNELFDTTSTIQNGLLSESTGSIKVDTHDSNASTPPLVTSHDTTMLTLGNDSQVINDTGGRTTSRTCEQPTVIDTDITRVSHSVSRSDGDNTVEDRLIHPTATSEHLIAIEESIKNDKYTTNFINNLIETNPLFELELKKKAHHDANPSINTAKRARTEAYELRNNIKRYEPGSTSWTDHRSNIMYAQMAYQLSNNSLDPLDDGYDYDNTNSFDELTAPSTLDVALAGEDKEHWYTAYKNEINKLTSRDSFEVLPADFNMKSIKPISSRFVLRLTRKVDGTLKYKVRLVAKGFTQRFGINYLETFAPTCKYKSFCAIMQLAAIHNWDIKGIDVENAFIESPLNETIYLKLPKELNNQVVRLKKSLYGLKQAGHEWNKLIDSKLLAAGFTRTAHDQCVYTRKNNDNTITYVLVYVDDVIVTGPNTKYIDETIDYLSHQFTAITIEQELKRYIGVDIIRDRDNNLIKLSQRPYISKITAPVSNNNIRSNHKTTIPLDPSKDYRIKGNNNMTPIYDLTGQIRYLADHTRPDIAFPSSILASANLNPAFIHVDGINQTLRYLNSTSNFELHLGGDKIIELIGMSDASYIPHSDSKSQLSYAIWMNLTSGAIVAKSKKDKLVGHHSTEVELRAIDLLVKDIIWFRGFLKELSFEQHSPTKVYTDSQSAIKLCKSESISENQNHIIMLINFLREQVQNNIIEIHYIETENNVVDILTKAKATAAHTSATQKLLKGFDGNRINSKPINFGKTSIASVSRHVHPVHVTSKGGISFKKSNR